MSISADIRATDRIGFVGQVVDEVSLREREPGPSDRHVVYPYALYLRVKPAVGPAVHHPGRTHPAGVRRLRPPRLRRGEPAHRPAARLRLLDHDAARAAAEPARAAPQSRRRLGGALSARHRHGRPAGAAAGRRAALGHRRLGAVGRRHGRRRRRRHDRHAVRRRAPTTTTAASRFPAGSASRPRPASASACRPPAASTWPMPVDPPTTATSAGCRRRRATTPIASRRSAWTPSTRSGTSSCAARWWRAGGTCRSRTATRRWSSTPWARRSRRASRSPRAGRCRCAATGSASRAWRANGVVRTWDANVLRVEGAVGYLVRRNVRLKAGYQYNWRDGGRERSIGLAGAQLLYWF